MYVLKEKLKLINGHLKEWSKNHLGNMGDIIEEARKKMNEMDVKGKVAVLLPDEVNSKREASSQLYALSRIKTSIIWKTHI